MKAGRSGAGRSGWRAALAVASCAGWALTAGAQDAAGPHDVTITGDKVYVCASRPHYEGLWDFEKNGQAEALGKGIAFGLLSGGCVMLQAGETVQAEAGNQQSAFTQVRRQGSDRLWWIARQRLR